MLKAAKEAGIRKIHPALPEAAHSGLGSSVVDALARKLNASVEIADTNPGTAVSISHA
jgi:two-component system, sensor histidine kinase PdtaS